MDPTTPPESRAGTPVLVITGPVGVGKTTVATAISERLDELQVAHALIDLDWLRWCHPSPVDDPFHVRLGLQNLADVWSRYLAAGAAQLILADVVETRAQVAEYQAALPDAVVQVVRLQATLATIHRRLEGRETEASLEWYRHRAWELDRQMERERVGDILIDTDGKTSARIAVEALALAGWTLCPSG